VEVILVVAAHPYPARSRAHRMLAQAVRSEPGVDFRSLYDLYPDFDIDAAAEQRALESAGLVVWMHPFHWYGAPALLKLWFERVLVNGWAHGEGGRALAGKDCLWVTTTGGDEQAYSAEGRHERPFAAYVAPIEQTARYCGMRWLDPLVVHGAHRIPEAELAAAGERLRERLAQWRSTRARGQST
jgi:glutathione-regulated potassium-efflux system ancillary protein KefF